jgi:FAD:protein FMN transferase
VPTCPLSRIQCQNGLLGPPVHASLKPDRRERIFVPDGSPHPTALASIAPPRASPRAPPDSCHHVGGHRGHGRNCHGGGQGTSGSKFDRSPRACPGADAIDFDDADDAVRDDYPSHHWDFRYDRDHPPYVPFGDTCADDNDDPSRTDDDNDSTRRHVWGHLTAMTDTLAGIARRSFRAIGTTATVAVPDPLNVNEAESRLRLEVDAIDRACSRFRPDSELEHLHRQAGRTVAVSALLFEALTTAVAVAERTHGAVDPTVGSAMSLLGYDRDFDQIGKPPPVPLSLRLPVVGYHHVHLNARTRTVRIPQGVRLDLGSSAKALAADKAAARIADQLGTGVLVDLGGDVSVDGPAPDGGWAIGIALASSARGDDADQVVAIRQGGLASSSTTVRSWTAGTERVHHILNPATGSSSDPYWSLVSAAGPSCVDANALTTAAVVWGPQALERLASYGQPMRLLRHDGAVFTLGGWPEGEPR